MKGYKLIVCIICAATAIIAAITAIIIFRNEIACCCSGLKDKLSEKVLKRNGEFADYADM